MIFFYIAISIIAAPIVAFMVVKFGAAGFYAAKRQFGSKQNRPDEGQHKGKENEQ